MMEVIVVVVNLVVLVVVEFVVVVVVLVVKVCSGIKIKMKKYKIRYLGLKHKDYN